MMPFQLRVDRPRIEGKQYSGTANKNAIPIRKPVAPSFHNPTRTRSEATAPNSIEAIFIQAGYGRSQSPYEPPKMTI